jgi:hypothetical protein
MGKEMCGDQIGEFIESIAEFSAHYRHMTEDLITGFGQGGQIKRGKVRLK